MYFKTIILVVFMYTGVNLVQCEQLPEYLHVCKKSNPELENCIIKSVEILRPFLVTGIPEIDLPKIEPIDIGDLLVADVSPDEGLSITAKDIKAYGCSNFDVQKLDVVDYGKRYNMRIKLPQLYVKGKYNIDGRILVLPIKGNGKFTGNFTNCIGDVKIITEKIIDGNTNHMTVKRIDMKIKIGKGRMNLENLFNGNKQLGDIINDAINNNFSAYSREILPLVEKALAKYFYKIGNKIINKYSEEQLFPM